MPFATNILVSTDFSRHADKAFEAAHKLATRCEASLTLIHVYDPSVPLPSADGENIKDSSLIEAELERQLEQVRARVFGDVDGAQAVMVESDEVAESICSYAKENGVDLIILANRGMSGLERLIIGSVAEEVVRHAHCAVLTVRSS